MEDKGIFWYSALELFGIDEGSNIHQVIVRLNEMGKMKVSLFQIMMRYVKNDLPITGSIDEDTIRVISNLYEGAKKEIENLDEEVDRIVKKISMWEEPSIHIG
ncbi:MAG: hypothetical protein COV29_01080 [Candidatus Yanofskybacteria bacterium CG10_big_fil_rev_8_21_14_0_10_36_16]|uniref:Uncharacterized protein n=1 Tax=Candidatus Yanofskybacteria bacterium CG10_big_fil_rev_8_21_14_0_10_36_16 TaxID=1975096 RepID=A0A2J0QAY2_9BACT|nr:MAG: hypothetical protein COV29_01080 [Candidatus Yanofskybacteria bacterium CG10_big_fil_rev_8_21_14_0_10_36_16]